MKTNKINTAIILLFLGSFLFQIQGQDDKKKTTHESSSNSNTKKATQSKSVSTKFTLSPQSLSFSGNGETKYVSISPSSTEWTYSGDATWIVVWKENDNSIAIRCTSNPSTSPRNTKITIQSGEREQREIISLSQAGKEIVNDDERLSIQSVEIASFDKNGKALTNYGDPIPSNTQSIKGKFTYNNLQNDKATIKLDIKVTDPNGQLLKDNQSNNTYSRPNISHQLEGEKKANQTAIIPEFENESGNLFSTPGTYYYDIYCNNKKICQGKFSVKENSPASKPILEEKKIINNTLSISSAYFSFDKNGGTEYVNIYTDADNFSFDNVPFWLHITRSGNRLSITADKYYDKGGYRPASIKIKAGNAPDKTISITQNGPAKGTNPMRLKMPHINAGLSLAYVQKNWTSTDAATGRSNNFGFFSDDAVPGLQAGFRWDIYFAQKTFGLGIGTGLYYEFYYQNSEKLTEESTDYKYNFQEHSIYLPLHLIYRFDINDNFGFFINAGVGFDYGISATVKATIDGESEPFYTDDNIYDNEDWGNIKQFNCSMEYGGGIQIKNVMLNFSISKGLSDHSQDSSYKMTQNKGIKAGIVLMF